MVSSNLEVLVVLRVCRLQSWCLPFLAAAVVKTLNSRVWFFGFYSGSLKKVLVGPS
ncbi:hypothetical protein Hanom_Chr02g00114811 [Helianthus anomalus]